MAQADVIVSGHGSVVSFQLVSQAARDWVEEFVQAESWQFLGNSLCVDWRYADGLKDAALDAGLVVHGG